MSRVVTNVHHVSVNADNRQGTLLMSVRAGTHYPHVT
jgi:hypothetical protein